MTAPGWYPDPGGQPGQRYFDGVEWTNQFAPLNAPTGPGQSLPDSQPKSPRLFVIMLIAGAVTFVVAFVLMQLAFAAAMNVDGSGSLFFEIVGFAMYLPWLASIVATLVGGVGAIVRSVKQKRARGVSSVTPPLPPGWYPRA